MDQSWGTDLDYAFGGTRVADLKSHGSHSPLSGPVYTAPEPPAMAVNKPAVGLYMMDPASAAAASAAAAAAQFSSAAPGVNPLLGSSAAAAAGLGGAAHPGYFERLGARRKDVVRNIVLALVVALGISLHWVASHYMSEWLEGAGLEGKHEFLARCLYPVGITLLVWNIKALQ